MISKATMKTIFVLKTFNSIKYLTGIHFVVFLSTLYLPLASAENIQNLQQNASTTYEQMIQAKQLAENLAKDAAFAEKKLASVKQKLATAEQESEVAKKKAEQAKISMEQAIQRWKQATDTLANEWEKTERK